MKNRPSFHRISMLICATLLVAVAALATPRQASAQCCKTYNVLIQNTVPATCFPLKVTTAWSSLLIHTTGHLGPGLVTETAPNPPGCWGTLVGLSINGVAVPPPFTGQTVDLGGGCKVSVGIISDAVGGCITIVIF